MDRRKRLRLRGFDYGRPGVYFVTVCTRGRGCRFGRVEGPSVLLSETGRTVARALTGIDVFHPGVGLDVSVVMPNHVHAIVLLDRGLRPPPLPAVVGAFKARASRTAGEPLWQRGYHDRIVRDEKELDALREYVLWNPLRWELDTENPECRGRARTLGPDEIRPLHPFRPSRSPAGAGAEDAATEHGLPSAPALGPDEIPPLHP